MITFRKDSTLLLIRENAAQDGPHVHALIWTPQGLRFLMTPWEEEQTTHRDEVEMSEMADGDGDPDEMMYRYQRALARAENEDQRAEMIFNMICLATNMGNFDAAAAQMVRYAEVLGDPRLFADQFEVMVGGWPEEAVEWVRSELAAESQLPESRASPDQREVFDAAGYVSRLKQALIPSDDDSPGLRLLAIGANYRKTRFLNGNFMGGFILERRHFRTETVLPIISFSTAHESSRC